MAPLDPHGFFAIGLTLVTVLLFSRKDVPLETSGLIILCVLASWFELFAIEYQGARLSAADVLAGFGSEALVTICVLLILARCLERTGALQPIAYLLAKLWTRQPRFAFLLTLLTAAILSMFLNNTPVVAILLPLLVAVTVQTRTSPSAILMPVGFATIVGGMTTTIGTSTNLLVTSVAADLGMREFRMFEFALPVFIVGSVAIVYLWLVAPRLLPVRTPPMGDIAPRIFEGRLRILAGSIAEGKTLSKVVGLTMNRMKVLRVLRGSLALSRLPTQVLKAGDILIVRDRPALLKQFEKLLGAALLTSDGEAEAGSGPRLDSDEHLAEVVVTRGSLLDGHSLEQTRALLSFGVVPIAVHRAGKKADRSGEDIGGVLLHAGDVLLLQGTADALARVKASGLVLVMDGRIDLPRTTKAPLVMVIMIGVVVLAATGLVRISIAALAGFVLAILLRCINWREAAATLDRRIIIIIVVSLALGVALSATGAAAFIAGGFVAVTDSLPPWLILAGFLLIIALLTEAVTNNAVAVLATPIAIDIATQMGVSPEPFVLAVLYGANMSYLTPIGYQTNLLVMSAGGYEFSDFFRAGLPLQLIMWLGLAIVLPWFYPF